jgi:hypothetical protein
LELPEAERHAVRDKMNFVAFLGQYFAQFGRHDPGTAQ